MLDAILSPIPGGEPQLTCFNSAGINHLHMAGYAPVEIIMGGIKVGSSSRYRSIINMFIFISGIFGLY